MKRYIVWAIVVGVIISLAWALTVESEATYVFPAVKKVELIKSLVPICACESTGNKNGTPTHYDGAGKVLRGKVNPADTGLCQINVTIHRAEIERMGLDVEKEQDNIIFANWLYGREGSKPWNWSKGCWR